MKIEEVIKSSSGGNGIDIILVLVKILRTKTVVEKRIILSTTTTTIESYSDGLERNHDSYSTIIVVAKDYFIYFFSMYSFNSNNA